MPYFAIKNHITREIKRTYDDALEAANDALYGRPKFTIKADRRKWLAAATTDTVIVSLFEGLNPDLRVSVKEGNPVAVMHGVIMDYDAASPGTIGDTVKHLETFYEECPALRPQWLVLTPSGHHRLIWEFNEPCSLRGCPDTFIATFLAEFRKTVRASSALAGLDESAYLKPSTYYDAAGGWERVNPDPFPTSDVDGVFFSAVRKASRETDGTGLTEIPIDAVKERLEELFPGRWPSDIPFVDGCRGPAVWDPTSTNPTTTIYTTKGAYRFSSDRGFHSYQEILGRDFVRQWEDNKLGQAAKAFYYRAGNGGNYFVKIGGVKGAWTQQQLGDLHRRLVIGWRLNRKAPSASEASEVDQVVQHIQDHKRIDGLLPFIFDKRETLTLMNKTFLNTSTLRVMEPALEAVDSKQRGVTIKVGAAHPYRWGAGFPWIADWLSSWFAPGAPRKQLVYLLAWLKQGYEGARNGTPQKGHALFLVGGTNRGKTLFNGEWMELVFGASTDASEYLLGRTGFNKELLESGWWRIDDAKAAQDKATHTTFTEGVKRFVANPTVEYHPKYVDAQSVPFNGRLCCTLNEDEESLRMIPDLDRNIADKLIILRLSDNGSFLFPERGMISKNLKTQTPYFLRWLINWTPPKAITHGHTRFGMKNFIHKDVRMSSLSAGLDSDLLDIMLPLWDSDEEFRGISESGGQWEGSAAQLLGVLVSNPVTSLQARGLTTRVLGRKLASLAGLPGSGVTPSERTVGKSRLRAYRLQPPLFVTAHEESVAC
jgi:hypothetical protein